MYGIFRITDDNRIIIDKDAIKLCPELTKLSQDELKYVIIVYDWFDSPYRKKPISLRKILAKRTLWKDKKIDPEKRKVVIDGIEAYKSLIHDYTRSTADAIRTKIELLNKKLLADDLTTANAKSIIDQLSFFTERLEKLDNDIKAEDFNLNEIKGKLKLSFIEVWQRRQQEHRKSKEIENNLNVNS